MKLGQKENEKQKQRTVTIQKGAGKVVELSRRTNFFFRAKFGRHTPPERQALPS